MCVVFPSGQCSMPRCEWIKYVISASMLTDQWQIQFTIEMQLKFNLFFSVDFLRLRSVGALQWKWVSESLALSIFMPIILRCCSHHEQKQQQPKTPKYKKGSKKKRFKSPFSTRLFWKLKSNIFHFVFVKPIYLLFSFSQTTAAIYAVLKQRLLIASPAIKLTLWWKRWNIRMLCQLWCYVTISWKCLCVRKHTLCWGGIVSFVVLIESKMENPSKLLWLITQRQRRWLW